MSRQPNLCNAFSSLYISNIIYVCFTSITKFNIGISLRSKRFCGFSEQRKTEERHFGNFAKRKNGAWGRGKGMKETLASKSWYFAKRPPSSFCCDLSTCRASTSCQLVISSQSKSDQNKQSDGARSESSARFSGFSEQRKKTFFGLSLL